MQKPRKDGLFEAKLTDPTTGKRRSFYATSTEEAKRKGLGELGIVDGGDTLADYYFDTHLPAVAHLRSGTLRSIGWAMDGYVIPALGRRELATVTRKDLQLFFNRLAASKVLEPTTVALVKKILSGVFSLAEEDELILRNPVRGVRLAVASPKEVEPLTFAKAKELVESTSGELRNSVVVMLLGLRIGECCAVAWSDLDDCDVLHVQRQKVKEGKEWLVTSELKTPQSNRLVPVPKEFMNLLERTGLLLAGDTNPAAVWRLLKPLGVRPHQLRHTFISLMENELEAPRRVVAQLVGKAKSGEMDRYSKSNMDSRRRWTERYAKTVVNFTTTGVLEVAQ